MLARHPRRVGPSLTPRHERRSDEASDGTARLVPVTLIAVVTLAMSYPRWLGPSFPEWLTWASTGILAALVLLPPKRIPSVPWLVVAALAWFTLTALWSQSPGDTIEGAGLYIALSLLAGVAAGRARPDDVPLGVAAGLMLVMGLSVGATVLGYEGPAPWNPWFTDGALVESFQGLYGNRNILAYTVVVLLPGALALGSLGRSSVPATIGVIGLAGILITQVRSATGIVTTIIVVSVAAVAKGLGLMRSHARSRRARRSFALVGGAGIVMAAAATVLFISNAIAQKSGSFSGRTPLWGSVIDASSGRLWTGHGWGSVWNYHWMPAGENTLRSSINAPLTSPLAHGHNAALDLLPQVGLIGIAIVVGIQVWAGVRLIRSCPSPARTWALLTLVAINVAGLTEPTWAIPIGWGLLVMVAVVAGRLPRRPPVEG